MCSVRSLFSLLLFCMHRERKITCCANVLPREVLCRASKRTTHTIFTNTTQKKICFYSEATYESVRSRSGKEREGSLLRHCCCIAASKANMDLDLNSDKDSEDESLAEGEHESAIASTPSTVYQTLHFSFCSIVQDPSRSCGLKLVLT